MLLTSLDKKPKGNWTLIFEPTVGWNSDKKMHLIFSLPSKSPTQSGYCGFLETIILNGNLKDTWLIKIYSELVETFRALIKPSNIIFSF